MHLGWSIVDIEESQVIYLKNIVFLSLTIDFVLANSADPDEMSHYAPFHLGHRCLSKYPIRDVWSTKDKTILYIFL